MTTAQPPEHRNGHYHHHHHNHHLPGAGGDLNNVSAMRDTREMPIDPAYAHRSLAIRPEDDDASIRSKYRPFIIDNNNDDDVGVTDAENDWVDRLELSTVVKMAEEDLERTGERIKVLVLTGSLRKR